MNSIFLKIYLPNLIVCVCLLFLGDVTLYARDCHHRCIIPEPTARSAVRRGLLIPLGYLHPGKCEHSEVQSHRFCHGRFSSLCACASHHRFQKYGGLYEERTAEHWLKASEKAKTKTRTTATRLQETPEKR